MSRNQAKTDRRRRELQRLQLAVARQQVETAQSRPAESEAKQIKPVVGMPADIVLTLPGFSRKDRLRSPVLVGWDRNGLKVRLYYHDVTLLLKRWEQGGVTCYRVAKVEERNED